MSQSACKCINLKPVFAGVLPRIYQSEKKGAGFSRFFQSCLHSVSKRRQNAFISRRFLLFFCTDLQKWKLLIKANVFQVFFKLVSTKCLKSHAKCIHLKTIFARVLHAFTKMKIGHKNDVFSTFFKTCLYKVCQSAFKRLSFQNCFCTCFARIYKSEKCPQNRLFLHVFFFKLVSTMCLKKHAKCIYFKTVFECFFHAFTKVKIAHKNAFFYTFFFKLVSLKCLRTHANTFTSRRFLPVFCTHLPKLKLLTKTTFLTGLLFFI